jgi:hypothetical protein
MLKSMKRAERILKSTSARRRRKSRKRMIEERTLSLYAKLRRLRIKK